MQCTKTRQNVVKVLQRHYPWGVCGIPPWPLTGTEILICEVCRLAQLILVMTAMNAVIECSFSAMRRLKTYLRSTMSQSRINNVILLNIT